MKAVIFGTDLMYDKSGRLVPIEINTNIGYDSSNRVESTDEWLDLSGLIAYVQEKKFEKVVLDISSSLRNSFKNLEQLLQKALKGIAEVKVTAEEEYEDRENALYIRVRFSDEAVVDSYCRDKIAFLNVIYKSSKIAQKFLYKEDGEVKGEMKDFLKNGEDPNYIVKYRYPQYAVDEYPKYYKLKSLKAVQKLAESLEDDYLIMPCYLNEDNMYNGERFVLFRQWSLIVPDEEKTLRAIDMGSYTKLSGKVDRSLNKFDEKTGELLEGRVNYSSKNWMKNVGDVLLEEGDQVLMADGTWKDVGEVKRGDEVLSVDVPYAKGTNIKKHTGDYNISADVFEEESKYTVNKVRSKSKVEGFQDIIHMTFEEDQEEWWDTANSSYPVLDKEDGTVEFKELKDLEKGDKVYLIALTDPDENTKVEYVERTVKETWIERKLEEGYTLSLDGSHLFITRSPESTAGYISTTVRLEHNEEDCGEYADTHGICYWGDYTDPRDETSFLKDCWEEQAAQGGDACECSTYHQWLAGKVWTYCIGHSMDPPCIC
jgi:hypothetical protein